MCRLRCFYCMLLCVLISEKNYVRCACKGSVVVFCDSITDLQHESSQKKQIWEEVTVGVNIKPSSQRLQEPSYYLVSEYYGENVEKLTIINQFNRSNFNFPNARTSLRSLTFYNNDLKRVTVIMTPHYTRGFDIVSFHHNNIENIEFVRVGLAHSDFKDYIKTLDLSYNKMTSTGLNQFLKNIKVTNLILNNNKLMLIRPDSLPENLKRLHLDHNRFVYFSTINLNSNNVSQLEFLTVAHNQLHTVDDLPVLDALNHLDLSFNNLHYIFDVFRYFKNLKILNLSENNLIRFALPQLNTDPNDVRIIHLAFNRLRNLDLEPVKNYTVEVSLFGNPWNCECIDSLKNSELFGKRFVEKKPCDDRFSDYIPYCVINDFHGENCDNEPVHDHVFDLFRNMTRRFVPLREGFC